MRNGRVSVVADSVRDYVEGMTVIEDTASVPTASATASCLAHTALREGDAASRPATAPGHQGAGGGQAAYQAAPAMRPGAVGERVSATGGFGAPAGYAGPEDDEGGYLGDNNPFAAEEPDWMDGEPEATDAGLDGGRLASRRWSCILGAGQYPASGQRSDAGPQGRCAFLWARAGDPTAFRSGADAPRLSTFRFGRGTVRLATAGCLPGCAQRRG